jgi:membrane protease YdiL (CAAX protease family)
LSSSSESPLLRRRRLAGAVALLPWRTPVAGYSVMVVAALAIQATVSATVGTAACAVLVVVLLGHHVIGARETDPRLDPLLALALVALTGILALALPVDRAPAVLWPVIVALPLLLGIRRAAQRLNLHRAELGLVKGRWREQAAIAAAGVPLGLAVALVLKPEPLEAPSSWAAFAGAAITIGLFAGAVEEILLRGLLQPLVVRAAGARGVAVTAALSAAMYLGSRSAAVVATAGAVAFGLGMLRRLTGSIAGIAVAHALLVAGALLIWPQVLGTAPDRSPRCAPTDRPFASAERKNCPSDGRGRASVRHPSP